MEHKETVPSDVSASKKKNQVTFTYTENGAKVVKANLIYTTNGGQRYEEWFSLKAKINSDNSVTAFLPEGTTHYIMNLIDAHDFLVSYPEMPTIKSLKKAKEHFSKYALRNK